MKTYYYQKSHVICQYSKPRRPKKLHLPYIYIESNKIVEHGNFPNGWVLSNDFLIDAKGNKKKVNNYLGIFKIIQFKSWLDYYESLIKILTKNNPWFEWFI